MIENPVKPTGAWQWVERPVFHEYLNKLRYISYKPDYNSFCFLGKVIPKNTVQCMIFVELVVMGKY